MPDALERRVAEVRGDCVGAVGDDGAGQLHEPAPAHRGHEPADDEEPKEAEKRGPARAADADDAKPFARGAIDPARDHADIRTPLASSPSTGRSVTFSWPPDSRSSWATTVTHGR